MCKIRNKNTRGLVARPIDWYNSKKGDVLNLLIVEDGAIREGREYLTEQGFSMCLKQKMDERLKYLKKSRLFNLTRYYDASKNGFTEVLEGYVKLVKFILMLTALHDEETQVRTFELLVDGFIQNHSPSSFA